MAVVVIFLPVAGHVLTLCELVWSGEKTSEPRGKSPGLVDSKGMLPACGYGHKAVRSHVRCLHPHNISALAALAPGYRVPSTVHMCVSNARPAFLPHCCQV